MPIVNRVQPAQDTRYLKISQDISRYPAQLVRRSAARAMAPSAGSGGVPVGLKERVVVLSLPLLAAPGLLRRPELQKRGTRSIGNYREVGVPNLSPKQRTSSTTFIPVPVVKPKPPPPRGAKAPKPDLGEAADDEALPAEASSPASSPCCSDSGSADSRDRWL
eukprot:SAG31_NODE_2504_length_5592_cov_3.052977_2_plen_163_part_00